MHKDMHCAVMIDCWMNKLGEISFENRPSKFPAFVENVRTICFNREVVFGLEDTRGFGRNLAAYLVGRRFDVKHVNPAYTSAVRLASPIVHKDDSYDAYCVARVLRDMVDTLPDAKHEDIFWTIRQLVKRRDMIVKNNVMNKNQLQDSINQLTIRLLILASMVRRKHMMLSTFMLSMEVLLFHQIIGMTERQNLKRLTKFLEGVKNEKKLY